MEEKEGGEGRGGGREEKRGGGGKKEVESTNMRFSSEGNGVFT